MLSPSSLARAAAPRYRALCFEIFFLFRRGESKVTPKFLRALEKVYRNKHEAERLHDPVNLSGNRLQRWAVLSLSLPFEKHDFQDNNKYPRERVFNQAYRRAAKR